MGCPPHVCFSLDSDRTADILDRQLRADFVAEIGIPTPREGWSIF
jgi:hypothetical protein